MLSPQERIDAGMAGIDISGTGIDPCTIHFTNDSLAMLWLITFWCLGFDFVGFSLHGDWYNTVLANIPLSLSPQYWAVYVLGSTVSSRQIINLSL